MKSKGQIVVDTWSDEVRPSRPVPARRFVSSRTVGIIGTLIVHLLVVPPALWGSHARAVHQPEAAASGATGVQSDEMPANTLVLLDLPMAAMTQNLLGEELASAGSKLRSPLLTVIGPDPLPRIDIPSDSARSPEDADPIDSGDPAARAALFGRYTGQIDARIERAWRRPRSAVNADLAHLGSGQNNHASAPDDVFNCVVRIIQDAQGVVQEVQLIACNGTAEWRQSLVSAIFASSPLPAPPSPTVFTRTLMMTFRGHAYSAESDADDYAAETAYAARR